LGTERKGKDNPFGILAFLSWNHSWNNFKYSEKDLKKSIELLVELGVSFVRLDFFWQDIEPQKGEFNFSKYDYIVKLLYENNINILAILDYCADWAGKSWNGPPDNLDDFVSFAKKVVQRYKDKIKYWEIWNEPDSKVYWQPQDEMKTYLKLLKKTYKAIKKIDLFSKSFVRGINC
jgi:beta-glucosidase/6-phospho-beta-glucosidase/beta-galactosidase